MIVSRWILTAKDPDALLAHQKFIRKRFWAPDVVRVYAPIRGADSNVIVWEEQHESMAAYRKRSEERHSDPEFDTIVEQRLRELVTDGHHEVWEAVDLESNRPRDRQEHQDSIVERRKVHVEYRSFGKLDWQVSVPCTQCRDCMPCPNGVDIPANFDAYNRGMVHDDLDRSRFLYSRTSLRFGQAERCTQCSECEPNCPHQIPIGERMPRVHAVLGEGQPYPGTARKVVQ